MLKAVCVEAGMLALRRDASIIKHEDFVEGIQAVQMKKKAALQYYAWERDDIINSLNFSAGTGAGLSLHCIY